MKAIAKKDCNVTLTYSLDHISMNNMIVKKGDVIELPVFEDRILHGEVRRALGDRSIVFSDKGLLIPTYAIDFDYVN